MDPIGVASGRGGAAGIVIPEGAIGPDPACRTETMTSATTMGRTSTGGRGGGRIVVFAVTDRAWCVLGQDAAVVEGRAEAVVAVGDLP
jgi:hypothetical protein